MRPTQSCAARFCASWGSVCYVTIYLTIKLQVRHIYIQERPSLSPLIALSWPPVPPLVPGGANTERGVGGEWHLQPPLLTHPPSCQQPMCPHPLSSRLL